MPMPPMDVEPGVPGVVPGIGEQRQLENAVDVKVDPQEIKQGGPPLVKAGTIEPVNNTSAGDRESAGPSSPIRLTPAIVEGEGIREYPFSPPFAARTAVTGGDKTVRFPEMEAE